MMVVNPTACNSPLLVMSVTFLLCFSISILLPCYVYMLNTDTDTDILYEKLTFSKKECSRD